MEGLLRWKHPKKVLLLPASFLPLAEETGTIEKIGSWVVQEGCRQARAWKSRARSFGELSLNFSARDLRSSAFPALVFQALAENELPPETLRLEITETAAMGKDGDVFGLLQVLVNGGVKISIDDFGTGYSSLQQLGSLPADVLKIDLSFVSEIGKSRDTESIISATIAMAHRLRRRVVAEGIEEVAQREILLQEGCDMGQGFLFGKPHPAPACN